MSEERKKGAPVVVELSLDQALVLFDWLSRFNNDDSAQFEDQAEQRALWDIEATLKRTLVEPLQDDYKTRLEQARTAVRDPEKGIYSIDLPGGAPELPSDPEECWVVVQADIGVEDGEAADEFTFYVCTPAKLTKAFEQQAYIFGKHLLIVPRFDWHVVEDAISSVCDQVHGENWDEIAGQLNAYGGWEFNQYVGD